MEILQLRCSRIRRRRPFEQKKPRWNTYTLAYANHILQHKQIETLCNRTLTEIKGIASDFFRFRIYIICETLNRFYSVAFKFVSVCWKISRRISKTKREKERNLFRWMPFFICTFVDVLYSFSLFGFSFTIAACTVHKHTVCHAK